MKILGIIIAIILFVVLIIIHELGHLLAAKICGVRVNEFSVGMGPLIFDKTIKDTQYSVRAVPLGGYCRLEGEEEDSDDPSAFNNASSLKKIFILVAGAFNNIVLCIIILFFVFLYAGSYSSILGEVTKNSPADLAGLQVNDRIVSVNDVISDEWPELVNEISISEGEIDLAYERDGKINHTNLLPEYNTELGRKIIGISCKVVHSPKAAIKEGFNVCIDYFLSLRDFLVQLVTGKADGSEVMGVVGIVSVISEEAQYGIINVIYLIAIISLNLGLVNLLPIPALDGGRIFFIIIRALSGGRISEEAERKVNAIGMIILIALMIFLIFKDSYNIIVK